MKQEEENKIQYLIEQMTHNHSYSPTLMKTAVSLYLRSRNCYNVIRECLNLPHLNIIKNYFGTIGSPGEMTLQIESTFEILPTLKRILPDWPCLPNNLGGLPPPPPGTPMLIGNF